MKAVFTARRVSSYDDDVSVRYHFPRTYLGQAEQAVQDFIVYYEPRRTSPDLNSSGGLQSYFAVARLKSIEPDPARADHFYGYLDDYIDFDAPVRFDKRHAYFESGLQKDDGSTNKGAFGRAVRLIPDAEFEMIVRDGFVEPLDKAAAGASAGGESSGLAESQLAFERPVIESIVTRPFRDRVFTRQVQAAYGQRCAVTGIRLVNGGGRVEAQAAHIRPVASMGPDSVRNGVALSGTVHWMFDRGLISVDDDFRILKSRSLVPDGIDRLFHPSGKLLVPEAEHLQPHPHFLRYHRHSVFKEG
jgi:putative restriction endonuclease